MWKLATSEEKAVRREIAWQNDSRQDLLALLSDD